MPKRKKLRLYKKELNSERDVLHIHTPYSPSLVSEPVNSMARLSRRKYSRLSREYTRHNRGSHMDSDEYAILVEAFKRTNKPSQSEREELALQLNRYNHRMHIRERLLTCFSRPYHKIDNWFANYRRKVSQEARKNRDKSISSIPASQSRFETSHERGSATDEDEWSAETEVTSAPSPSPEASEVCEECDPTKADAESMSVSCIASLSEAELEAVQILENMALEKNACLLLNIQHEVEGPVRTPL